MPPKKRLRLDLPINDDYDYSMLPTEILLMIFKYMDKENVFKLTKVCKRFNDILASSRLALIMNFGSSGSDNVPQIQRFYDKVKNKMILNGIARLQISVYDAIWTNSGHAIKSFEVKCLNIKYYLNNEHLQISPEKVYESSLYESNLYQSSRYRFKTCHLIMSEMVSALHKMTNLREINLINVFVQGRWLDINKLPSFKSLRKLEIANVNRIVLHLFERAANIEELRIGHVRDYIADHIVLAFIVSKPTVKTLQTCYYVQHKVFRPQNNVESNITMSEVSKLDIYIDDTEINQASSLMKSPMLKEVNLHGSANQKIMLQFVMSNESLSIEKIKINEHIYGRENDYFESIERVDLVKRYPSLKD